nr:hypothetical protein BaRGS_024822 [Batillaria attramentaria]
MGFWRDQQTSARAGSHGSTSRTPPSDCRKFFQSETDAPLVRDDQVLCTTEFSKVVPLEGGEIVVSLVNGRPSAEDFSNNDALQEWTKATDVQLRMIRTKTLLGHLMAVARQDPTVTRRCSCKANFAGLNCDRCASGYYRYPDCVHCMCNMGGSQSPVCNKLTGQCQCRPRVTGQTCDRPIQSHFYPDLHQLKLEVEDGVTPEGARIRYGYDNRIFPDYSWRGYAILTDIQPEVQLEVDIRIPSLYQIIYRYINRNDNPVRGEITLTPKSQSGNAQTGQIIFLPTTGTPKFARVTTGAVTAFVLNPGQWTVSTKVPNIAFLDYFVLIPQDFYEATVLQQRVTNPCSVPGDPGPCLHYQYPDLIGYPFVPGIDAYVIVDNQRGQVDLYPDENVNSELGTAGMVYLNPNQLTFTMDLVVPDPGLYVLVVSYLNPTDRSQDLDVDVASLSGREKAKLTLHSCKYSTLCRQVFKSEDGMVAVFNISTGYVSLTFTGPDDVDIAVREIEIRGSVTKPGQYVILFHYYMPTEIGLMIPVTVYVNGQPKQGMFKPTYCPSVTGCRAAIMFDRSNIITLNGNDIRILLNNTNGGKIWLDYALIVPAEYYTPFDLELQPIDKSGDFLTNCVNEGFELSNDSEFCKDSVFTLTTEFNKGAVQCDCNVDGSLNFNCEDFGGYMYQTQGD